MWNKINMYTRRIYNNNKNVMFLSFKVFIVNFYAFIGNLKLREINVRKNVYEWTHNMLLVIAYIL